jgi:hypothetical protein
MVTHSVKDMTWKQYRELKNAKICEKERCKQERRESKKGGLKRDGMCENFTCLCT